MNRRRLSTGLPSNPRYPFTPDTTEHENFVDYMTYDGNGNYSREQITNPLYRPRDESPAPQVVRIAKQPEMIRRPSVRPSTGYWGNFGQNALIDDSKLPGAFHDTDGDASSPDFDREIIDPIPPTMAPFGYSHPAEMVDIYSDVSEDDLDFGRDQSLIFPQLPIEEVFAETSYILRMKSNPTGEGFTYVFADPTGRSRFYKISSSKNVSKRANEHRSICPLSAWGVKRKPAIPLREYKRLEKVAQSELMNLNYDPNCVCATQNREYFWGREHTAFEVLEFWARWLTVQSPYDKDGQLLPFWDHRLKEFEDNLPKYFKCGSQTCAKRTPDTIACQACLRVGWKAFAEAATLDKIEFASRTQIGIEWVHKGLLYLHQYVPMQEKFFLMLVDGIGWAISMCDRFKNPTLLLNILYARLVIPMIWSSIFTTNEYIPAIAIFEIVLFFLIYQIVRNELPPEVKDKGTQLAKKSLRILNRKPVPSTPMVLEGPVVATASGINAGRSKKQSKVVDIPDDRIQAILKEASKGTSKKIEPISIIPPETTARVKKFKSGRRRSDNV